jgi:hypothetical protein
MAEQTDADRRASQVPPVDREKGKAESPTKDEHPTKAPEEIEADVEIEDRFEATDN